MIWQIDWTESAKKELAKLDKHIQKKIRYYLKYKIAIDPNPRKFGKALTGDKLGLWRYRKNRQAI